MSTDWKVPPQIMTHRFNGLPSADIHLPYLAKGAFLDAGILHVGYSSFLLDRMAIGR